MTLSAKEAAEQVGMTKQGIIKAIRQGKISAQKDIHGQWSIEPVELFRVYSPVAVDNGSVHQPEPTSLREDTPSWQVEIRLLRERLADKDDVIADLRSRLDAESEKSHRLTLLLEAAQPQAKKGWWARLLGGE
jgi:hypothetical protein